MCLFTVVNIMIVILLTYFCGCPGLCSGVLILVCNGPSSWKYLQSLTFFSGVHCSQLPAV